MSIYVPFVWAPILIWTGNPRPTVYYSYWRNIEIKECLTYPCMKMLYRRITRAKLPHHWVHLNIPLLDHSGWSTSHKCGLDFSFNLPSRYFPERAGFLAWYFMSSSVRFFGKRPTWNCPLHCPKALRTIFSWSWKMIAACSSILLKRSQQLITIILDNLRTSLSGLTIHRSIDVVSTYATLHMSPLNWPGKVDSRRAGHPHDEPTVLKKTLWCTGDVVESCGDRPPRSEVTGR